MTIKDKIAKAREQLLTKGYWELEVSNILDLCDEIESLQAELAKEKEKMYKLREKIESISYYIGNPSAWDQYSEEGSEMLRSLYDFLNEYAKEDI